jgi:hypothetical protein
MSIAKIESLIQERMILQEPFSYIPVEKNSSETDY